MKIKFNITVAVIFILAVCGLASGDNVSMTLPDIDGWQNGDLQIVQLDTVSGNQGFWIRRKYVSAGGTRLTANLMGGKGPKTLHTPPSEPGSTANADSSDGPIGSGASYETIAIGESGGILEHDPVLGYSAVFFLDGAALTIESRGYALDRGDFIEEAGIILSALTRK